MIKSVDPTPAELTVLEVPCVHLGLADEPVLVRVYQWEHLLNSFLDLIKAYHRTVSCGNTRQGNASVPVLRKEV